jgi:hypothetical protein
MIFRYGTLEHEDGRKQAPGRAVPRFAHTEAGMSATGKRIAWRGLIAAAAVAMAAAAAGAGGHAVTQGAVMHANGIQGSGHQSDGIQGTGVQSDGIEGSG